MEEFDLDYDWSGASLSRDVPADAHARGVWTVLAVDGELRARVCDVDIGDHVARHSRLHGERFRGGKRGILDSGRGGRAGDVVGAPVENRVAIPVGFAACRHRRAGDGPSIAPSL